MHAITFSICALLFISFASAIPAPSPRVYSAIVRNLQKIPIRCTIEWTGINGPLDEPDVVTIGSKQEKVVHERVINMGSWTARAYMSNIQCGSMSLSHPFAGVTSLTAGWIFAVDKTEITSVGQGYIEE